MRSARLGKTSRALCSRHLLVLARSAFGTLFTLVDINYIATYIFFMGNRDMNRRI
jgi:hypothetical protein